MKYLGIFNDWVVKILKVAIAIGLSVMIVVTCIEIFRRYFFGATWLWSEELVRYIIVWITFVGGGVAYRGGALTRFDLVYGQMKQKTKDIVDLVMNQLILLFMIFVLYFGILKVQSPAIRLQTGIGLKIPMVIPYISIPLGMMLMILFNIEMTYNIIKRVKNHEGKES